MVGGMHGWLWHVWQGGHAWQGIGMHGRGVCMAGGMCKRGGACMAGGVFVVGSMHGRGGGVRGRNNGNCSGRYASYWNAFLFSNWYTGLFILNKSDKETKSEAQVSERRWIRTLMISAAVGAGIVRHSS